MADVPFRVQRRTRLHADCKRQVPALIKSELWRHHLEAYGVSVSEGQGRRRMNSDRREKILKYRQGCSITQQLTC